MHDMWNLETADDVQVVLQGFIDKFHTAENGFSDEATIVTDDEKYHSYCSYDSDIATGYGVGAFFFLLASQILVMVVSRCFCCGKTLSPTGSRAWAVVLFIFCWLTFLIAEACLLAGSVQNAYHTKYRTIFGADTPTCETLRKGVFAAGAAFTFFTGLLSEFYYISYSKARGTFQPYQFIGELEIQVDNEVILHARVGRDVDGMDLNLYQQTLKLLRQFQTDRMKN